MNRSTMELVQYSKRSMWIPLAIIFSKYQSLLDLHLLSQYINRHLPIWIVLMCVKI